MEIKGEMYRENGQWKIKLFVDRWIIDDVKLENDKPQTTIIVLHDNYVRPSMYRSEDYFGALLGSVLFEEVMDKK